MPKKIHGQPVDEEKWGRAKKRAAEEGHEGEYDYIMGIYKQMAGIEKSQGIDLETETEYDVDRRLVVRVKKSSTQRCGKCNATLFQTRGDLQKSNVDIDIKCRRCGHMNHF